MELSNMQNNVLHITRHESTTKGNFGLYGTLYTHPSAIDPKQMQASRNLY